MAGINTVTITAKTGPGLTVTTLVINNVSDINFDLIKRELDVIDTNGIIKEFDIDAITTITMTVSSKNYTVTIS